MLDNLVCLWIIGFKLCHTYYTICGQDQSRPIFGVKTVSRPCSRPCQDHPAMSKLHKYDNSKYANTLNSNFGDKYTLPYAWICICYSE